MIKVICIKEPEQIRHLKLGSVYEAEATSVIRPNNTLFGYRVIFDTGWVTAVSDKYLMPYNEWLALEREEQIKTILDE